MERGHGNLQRDREEQLQLRGQLANVYDVIRDLGLHHKIEEIPGCSFITIGRSKHRFSCLDKNLTWTVPAVRGARDGVQYVEQNTVLTSEKDEAILSLHKSGQEQADEIARLNSLVTNLASGLQAANNLEKDEAEIKKNLTRKVQEQEEEMKKLNLQLLNQSSQPLAEKEKSLLKLHEDALMQDLDLFLLAFAHTEFLISRDRLDYSLAVMREIMSDRGLDIMATTFKRITSTVENIDDIHISPDYTIMAEVLGGKVQLSLPRLMEVLRDDSVPYDIIAAIDEELSPVFENQLWANLQVLVEDFLEFLKTEALVALGSLKNPDDSDEDSDDEDGERAKILKMMNTLLTSRQANMKDLKKGF